MQMLRTPSVFFVALICAHKASALAFMHTAFEARAPTSEPRHSTPRRNRRNFRLAVTAQPSLDSNPPADEPPHGLIDTSAYEDERDGILEWLGTLTAIERTEPTWVGRDILTLSPSLLVQEHLDGLLPGMWGSAPQLFPTEADRAKFDFEWRYCLLSLLPPDELRTVLEAGMSNTHPLRLQLVACPSDADFALHAHAAVELDVPLVGDLHERRAVSALVPRGMLSRRAEHEVGAQGGLFAAVPSKEELKIVGDDVAERVTFGDHGASGAFVDRTVRQGQPLVNEVGSVHQSYTGTDGGCLLFVLGANVHAHFRPGKFRQRTGIDGLRGIDHLLERPDE